MKKLFIIDTYPKTEKQIQLLKDCINSVTPIGWDILIVSHYPIPTEIQNMVTYSIYDKNNLFIPENITPHIFSFNESFDFKVYLSGHALAITINMFNGFKFAENYNYDFCYFMEFDSILNHNDLEKLNDLVSEMETQNKDMIVFNPENFIVKDCYYNEDGAFFYETLLFGAKVGQFLLIFNPPRNLDEWYNNDMCYNLESSLHHKYKNLSERCLIVPSFVSEYLTESKINTHTFGMFVCEIINNQNNPNTPVLLINNIHGSKTTKEVKIYLNDELFNTVISYPGKWYYTPLSINNDTLKIEIFEDNIIESSESFELNLSFLERIKTKLSYINFK
jgi:hypothetical protein